MKTEEQIALLRSLGEVEEVDAKGKLWFKRELVLDSGASYIYWTSNRDYMIHLEGLIDQEITYSVGEKGNIVLHKLFPSAPKKSIPRPRSVEGLDREKYWEFKGEHDKLVSAILERQYFITLAKELAIPMGRLTDANWKELASEAIELGIQLHLKYGKLEIE